MVSLAGLAHPFLPDKLHVSVYDTERVIYSGEIVVFELVTVAGEEKKLEKKLK